MILDGLTLSEGSEAQNLTVATGSSFPSAPNLGELFYNTALLTKGLYTYDGAIWDKVVFTSIDLDTLLDNVGTPGTYKSVTTDSKGRITAGSGSLEDLSTSQATSLLDTFTSGLKGLTPASGGGTTNFLRADGSWVAVSAGGTTLSDDTTTTNASTFYPTMASNQTSGSLSAVVVSSSKLSYNPSIGTLNATNFNTTSDERAKENIRSLGYGLDEVLQMTGKKFEMKDSGQTSIGLIAQEVLKVIPEVVSDNGSDRLGVNYPVLTAVLIEAIKELTTRVAELEQKCKTL